MFGLSGLQIYDLQNERNLSNLNGQKFFGKFTKSELVLSDTNVITMNLSNDRKNSTTTTTTATTRKSNIKNRNNINHNSSNKTSNTNNNNNHNNSNNNNPAVQDAHLNHLGSEVDSKKISNNLSQVNANTVTVNTNSLKRLGGANYSLDMQKKKYMKVITFLNQHNHHLEEELAKEKRRRAEELSKIIKSLLCFEAKLKHDKKVINQKMYEKDIEISRLITLNRLLRKKFDGAEDIEKFCDLEDVSQNCPTCRKDYYDITGKDVWTQTFNDGRSSIEDNTENGSSSDETLSSSFYGARRSNRYTSKRNFRDYMRSRCMSIDDPSLDNSEENASTLSREDSNSTYEKTNAFSRKIERLHGVRRIESFTDEAEIDSENELNRRNKSASGDYESDEIFMPIKARNYRVKKFAESSPRHEFEASTDDWYASASDIDDSENMRAKPYGYNAVNPVLECVNQILLQQSMEESIMDGPASLESSENNSGSSGSHKDGTVSRKRVHFSTKNSMVHVPRDEMTSPRTVIENNEQKDCNLNYESIYSNEYERIGSEHNSSNHYVDMESKLGQEDRLMTLQDRPKKPPALPPKPANLIKFKRVLRVISHPSSIKEDEPKTIEEQNGESEEPDYCSISEVNETITSVQIIADVHKAADDDMSSNHSDAALSQKTDDVDEIFADIPKLPNVAAIIAPKVFNKFITNDNYISKESGQTKSAHIPHILAEINKKINNNSTPTNTPSKNLNISLPISPSKVISPVKVTTPSEDKLPLQAEFDWYNLDAEYGKSNQPDVIKETDINTLEYEMVTLNEDEDEDEDEDNISPIQNSVEYNLDEEFCLVNQPDIIKENVYESKTVCDSFPTIVDDSPCNHTVKINNKNFSNFISTSGLSTKPLPRQRKIYFSGPFV